jgi:hypothetical protein
MGGDGKWEEDEVLQGLHHSSFSIQHSTRFDFAGRVT